MRTIPFSAETHGFPELLTVPDGIETIDGFLGVTPDGMILCEQDDQSFDFESTPPAAVQKVQRLLCGEERALIGTLMRGRAQSSVGRVMMITRDGVDSDDWGAEGGRRYAEDHLEADERTRYAAWLRCIRPVERSAILRSAYQRQSTNYGTGGRIVEIPPAERLEQTLTRDQIDEASVFHYILNRRSQLLEALHARDERALCANEH